ncbi:DUF7477 domain-containing protein [Wenyingzhuangia sp. IMCC45574]
MKNLKKIIFILSIFIFQNANSQDFYETAWYSGGFTYKGLLVYYSSTDAFMRINYKKNNRENIISYDCTWDSFEKGGLKGYLLDGKNAKVIYGSNSTGYYPDNFFFSENNLNGTPYHFDDNDIAKGSLLTKLNNVTYWRKVDAKKLNKEYLISFFDTSEYKYTRITKSIASKKTATTNNTESLKWACLFRKTSKISKQKFFRTDTYPSTEIKKYWDLNYSITHLTYNNNKWVLIMSKHTGISLQKWRKRDYYPKKEIKEGWDDGYFITSLTYGNNEWALVLSKNAKYTRQKWFTNATFPQEKIKKGWDDGFYITSVGYGDGKWSVVMSKGTDYKEQMWRTRVEYPKKEIKEYWDKGYEISTLTYNKNKWVLVMSKNKSGHRQERWNTAGYFPYTKISNAEKDGFKIISIVSNQ